ncbi:MAG: hypothetical protein JSS61_02575 [Verrucomicrobia bacterium]|nr:hypothetical protein [Verrucomicrobiota bacterium]
MMSLSLSQVAKLQQDRTCFEELLRSEGLSLPTQEKMLEVFDKSLFVSYRLGKSLLFQSDKHMIFQEFNGCSNSIRIEGSSITLESYAHVAAPIIEMVGIERIRLGDKGLKPDILEATGCTPPEPVRVYAPEKLSLRAFEVCIGDATLEAAPQRIELFCNKLTRWAHPESPPSDFFELLCRVADPRVEIDRSCRTTFGIDR